jgi:hypothetical protein
LGSHLTGTLGRFELSQRSRLLADQVNQGADQGLSEVPNMTDVSRWGVMTMGIGLGNARFTNRADT